MIHFVPFHLFQLIKRGTTVIQQSCASDSKLVETRSRLVETHGRLLAAWRVGCYILWSLVSRFLTSFASIWKYDFRILLAGPGRPLPNLLFEATMILLSDKDHPLCIRQGRHTV